MSVLVAAVSSTIISKVSGGWPRQPRLIWTKKRCPTFSHSRFPERNENQDFQTSLICKALKANLSKQGSLPVDPQTIFLDYQLNRWGNARLSPLFLSVRRIPATPKSAASALMLIFTQSSLGHQLRVPIIQMMRLRLSRTASGGHSKDMPWPHLN